MNRIGKKSDGLFVLVGINFWGMGGKKEHLMGNIKQQAKLFPGFFPGPFPNLTFLQTVQFHDTIVTFFMHQDLLSLSLVGGGDPGGGGGSRLLTSSARTERIHLPHPLFILSVPLIATEVYPDPL